MSMIEISNLEAGVRILRLAKAPANAIDDGLLGGLQEALQAARTDASVRCVVLTGSGGFFCAGFDFSAARRDAQATLRSMTLYRDVHIELLSFPKPTVAMVNGHAVAGGTILVLACDYRLGVQGDYKVGLNEIAVGAAFPRAALEIATLRLPHARASELMLGAALYPANQAIRLGIVDELLPADSFEDTVLRRATRLAGFPREPYAHTKAALLAAALERMRAETPDEAAAMAATWMTEESRAARRRVREKLSIRMTD